MQENRATQQNNVMHSSRHGNLRFPVCGFDYVHITDVCAYPVGRDRHFVSADHQGVTVSPGAGAGGCGRGNDVIVTFQCEDGHEFSYKFGFHKGQTSLEQTFRTITQEEIAYPLWRD